MGVFRPARKVTDRNGRQWEIYVSRSEIPAWRPDDTNYDTSTLWHPLEVLLSPLLFLLYQIIIPVGRVLLELPGAVFRGRRSGVRIVEAITFWPAKEIYTWTTTGDHVQRVVDQIAAGLEQGDLARPLGATFRGGP
jgi:hypothetical protein